MNRLKTVLQELVLVRHAADVGAGPVPARTPDRAFISRRSTMHIGPYGPSGWHGACPYTGGVTNKKSCKTLKISPVGETEPSTGANPVGATEPGTGACPCVNGMYPSSPCRGERILFITPFQGVVVGVTPAPRAMPWARLSRPYRPSLQNLRKLNKYI